MFMQLNSMIALFLPHLKWLYTSGRDPCECKLCSSPYTRRRSKETRDEKPLKHSSTRMVVDKKPRKPRRFKTEAIYEPLRPMEKVLIRIPHENDPPTPGCISIPRLVSVPNIEKKLRPQYQFCQAVTMMYIYSIKLITVDRVYLDQDI